MSNERLKAFKERVKNDPEYAEYLKQRHKERMQNDPEYRAKKQANWKRKDAKRKAKRLNDIEALLNYEKNKQNRLLVSAMTKEQRQEHRRKQKQKSYKKFYDKYGICYVTFNKWQQRSGLTDIQEVIEYRNNYLSKKVGHTINNLCERSAKFYNKYGITVWTWKTQYKPKGYTLEQIAKIKNEAELKEKVRIDESLLAPQLVYVPTKKSTAKKLNKDKAYTEMQNKISRLNCAISIQSIRDAKINELQQNFYNQYGAM